MLARDTGWPPPELLVTVSITSGMAAAPSRAISGFKRGDVHIALEVQPRLGVGGFGEGKIHGARSGEFDVGAGGIEVSVGGDDVAGLAHDGEQNALGGPALMGGNHVAQAGEFVGDALEAKETLAARVGFIAAHERGPLFGGHGAGAGIGEKVDQNVVGFDEEEVVPGLLEIALALLGGGVMERFHALDPERFNDRSHCRYYFTGCLLKWTDGGSTDRRQAGRKL